MNICDICNQPLIQRESTAAQPYHYTEIGLSDVHLIAVSVYSCQKCGIEVADIPHPRGLHFVLAREILMNPVLMSGEEFRFLRKETGKSPKDFAQLIGVDPKTVKNWETLPYLSRQNDITVRFVVANLMIESHRYGDHIKDIAIPIEQEWVEPDPDIADLAKTNTSLRITSQGWEEDMGGSSGYE